MLKKLETLLEQTSFLLEKQKEAKTECAAIFADFLSVIDKKVQACKDAEDSRSLEKIHTMISEQAKRFEEETQEDIDFLAEQLKMLAQVEKISDEAKAKEIMNMIVDEDEEILETEEFKRGVLEEGSVSKQNLLSMVEDIKEALNEGSIKEVELLLESFAFDQDELDEELDDEEDACDCGVCDDDDFESCCSSKGHSGCHGCDKSCGGVDLFAEFNDYAERVEDKKKSK